jgi:hypothetical protein
MESLATRDHAETRSEIEARRQSVEGALNDARHQLAELTGLRLRGLLTDAEFLDQRAKLQQEDLRLTQKLTAIAPLSIEPVLELISFSKYAAEWFGSADDHTKRTIFRIAASNPKLKGKILSVEAAKPFRTLAQFYAFPNLLGVVDDVRTLLKDENCKKLIEDIRELRLLVEAKHRHAA